MTVGAYDQSIRDWLASARHPQFKRPYTELVYAPMQELLAYLRANGFKTFIVSGGSVEFMRPWAEQAYGIPPEQIIGSQQEVNFAMREGKPVLTRAPKIVFVDDGPGKPVGIYRQIGRRPIAAFGNSDGDLQMLQVTAAGEGRRLMLLVHHDDAEREFAYDRAVAHRQARQGLERGEGRQLDRRQHEVGLEEDLRFPEMKGDAVMQSRYVASIAALGFVFAGSVQAQQQPAAGGKKPNIVVFWGDDIGQSNISAYSHGVMGYQHAEHRPHCARRNDVHRLLRRAELHGRSRVLHHRPIGLAHGMTKVGLPGATLGLRKEDPTIAEMLKPLGYATGQFGKNHLGDRNEFLPTVHGFDEFYGNLYHLNAEEEPEHVGLSEGPGLPREVRSARRAGLQSRGEG